MKRDMQAARLGGIALELESGRAHREVVGQHTIRRSASSCVSALEFLHDTAIRGSTNYCAAD